MKYPDNIIAIRRNSVTAGPRLRGAATFKDLADEWFSSEGARMVEPANERRHVNHLRALWALTEEDLRPGVVKRTLSELLRPTGPLGAATVNKAQATGRRIIREAQINERWLGPNPFEVVPRLRQSRPAHRALSLEECRRLLPFLRDDRRREALVMLYLGLRPGEWKGLRREDVDLSRGSITVRRSNARNQTKTGKVRVVPIPSALKPVLIEALAVAPPTSPFVFAAPGGGLQRADAKLSRGLQSGLVRAGLVSGWRMVCRRKGCGYVEQRHEPLEGRCPRCSFKLLAVGVPLPVRFYDLRHTAATLHREAGCDPLVIQQVMGHAPTNLTDSLYTHLSDDYVRRSIDKLSI